ncbi:MAG TPA: tetratricopeptide repeat protein [Allocoleopsis sp.]
MSDSVSGATPLASRYQELIDRIVEMTLKGKIRSKEQVYQMLLQEVSSGTGEIFERCLGDRLSAAQRQVEIQTDELKLAKANRTSRALQTIQGEWERWQEQNQATEMLTTAVRQVVVAEADQRLATLLQVTDPNRGQIVTLQQWQQLAKGLQQQASTVTEAEAQQQIEQLAIGIGRGIEAWRRLEDHVVSWIYEQGQGQLGFEGVPGQRGPWALWAKQVGSPMPQALFQALAHEQSAADWSRNQTVDLEDWIELTVILRGLQQGLVTWFDKLVYDSKVGSKLSISTFLAFAVLWSQLAVGLGDRFANAAFQTTLQILRTFAQREYFPLYGGIFASFAGNYLRDALNYLDEPLRRAEGTQEKARILTLLGYSFRAQGQYERAQNFHQQALELARTAGDRPCEIANFNHLSRACVAEKNYAEAINYSQRALILSRQAGDRLGEANALANLGYSEVLQAQQLEQVEPETYERAIEYLQQGLKLSERLGDRQSQALCLSSLGIAHIVLDQPQMAIAYLEGGIQAAQFSGDVYLQARNLAYLAEAYYRLEHLEKSVYSGCLGMYLLEQMASNEWRQPAGLLMILQGQMGEAGFQAALAQHRRQIAAVIGVDGYDHIPQLLEQYRHST